MLRKFGSGMLIAFMALTLSAQAHAEVTVPAKVRYETQQGSSQWYSVEVHFLTGSELARATSNYMRFSSLKKYAVIFWGENQATVIEISTLMFCGAEMTQSCLPIFGNIDGEDEDGTEWEICTRLFCA